MAYPDTFTPDDLSGEAASELLGLLSGCPTSRGLRVWLASLSGLAVECEGQTALAVDG